MTRIKFIYAWYDFWIGFYWDKDDKALYFLPVPCFGIKILFGNRTEIAAKKLNQYMYDIEHNPVAKTRFEEGEKRYKQYWKRREKEIEENQ